MCSLLNVEYFITFKDDVQFLMNTHMAIPRRRCAVALSLLEFEQNESPRTCFCSRNFKNYECDSYLKQPLTPPHAKSLLLSAPHIIDWPLIFARYELHQSLEIIVYVTFARRMYKGVPSMNPIPSMCCKCRWKGSLKSFFQWNDQVDISLYLTEATPLCYSLRNNFIWTPSSCYF